MSRKVLSNLCFGILILGLGTFSFPRALLTQNSEPLITDITTNISDSNKEIMGEALSKFDPKIREYLAALPIVYGDVRTAVARTTSYEPSGREHIIVSRDWDNTRGESIYWVSYFKPLGVNKNDPVFSRSFKLNLLVHEYLHHAELKAEIDIETFFGDVHKWYRDPNWGEPDTEHSENYLKVILFWNLYGGNGMKDNGHSYPGRGEFAYIGAEIALGGITRLQELPANIIEYYRGILQKDFLAIPVLSK